jgi:electron transport complex protein RnfA
MELVWSFITAALVALFLQNSIYERALGINILLYASRRKRDVIGFTAGLCYITVLSSAVIWVFDRFFGKYAYYNLVAPVLYILVIGIIYIVSLLIVWRYFHKLFKRIKKFVHLTVFNCAVLGALFLNSQTGSGLLSYIGYGLGTALGFFLAGYLLYIAYDRLNSELVPAAFRGMPIMIIYVGILSMALHAFAGYVV